MAAMVTNPMTHAVRNLMLTTPSGSGHFLTSLHFCCAGWALTRGRELSGERPRTLI